MKQNIMKQFIYLLFLLIGLGQTLFAQSTELLEVRLLNGMPFPLGKDWHQAQKEGWKEEVEKDKKNVRAWENYLSACDAEYEEETDSLQKLKLDKERHRAFRNMCLILDFAINVCFGNQKIKEKKKLFYRNFTL